MPTIPPRNPDRPDLLEMIRDLQREVRMLREKPRDEDNPKQHLVEVVFALNGSNMVGDSTPAYLVKENDCVLVRADFTVDSGKGAFKVMKNGAQVYKTEVNDDYGSEEDLMVDIENFDRLKVVVADSVLAQDDMTNLAVHLHLLVSDESEYL